MTDKLTSLRQLTTVVADTGDIAAMKLYQPQDATTNPSLILNAAQIPEYRKLIDEAIAWARGQSSDREQQIADFLMPLGVRCRGRYFGQFLSDFVPRTFNIGPVEADARGA